MFNKIKPSKRDIVNAQLSGNTLEVEKLSKERAEHDEKIKIEEAARQALHAQEVEKIRDALAKVAATEHGRIALQFIRRQCAMGSPTVFEVDLIYKPEFTLQQTIKQNVWKEIANFLPLQTQVMLEFPQVVEITQAPSA